MIDIIIPAYNAHSTITRTLFSIASQINLKDLNIYIVNDASSMDYSHEISYFKETMNIHELILKENSGPGVARQFGIDNSTSEYIVFIDADDIFFNSFSLKILYENISNSNYDIVISSFNEMLDDGSFLPHNNDSIWLHGKIYRRSFLEKNNIKFNNSRNNEDNGFNQLVLLHNSNVKDIDDCTYIWMYNSNSITRKNHHEYLFNGLFGYIYNITWALTIAIRANCDNQKISELTFATLITIYYYYIMFLDNPNVNRLLEDSKDLYQISLNYPLDSDETKSNLWQKQFNAIAKDINIEDRLNPPISLNEFFMKIERT